MDSIIDGFKDKHELDKRGISPEDTFNPNKSVTLREDEWEKVHEALTIAIIAKDCQDGEMNKVMNKILRQLYK